MRYWESRDGDILCKTRCSRDFSKNGKWNEITEQEFKLKRREMYRQKSNSDETAGGNDERTN